MPHNPHDVIPRRDQPADCGGCSLQEALSTPTAMRRREFLRAAGLAMASLGLLGADARAAGAMPMPAIGEVTGRDGATAEEKQYAIPAADGRQYHSLIKGSKLEIIPGAEHFLHQEQPERVTSLIEEFLA